MVLYSVYDKVSGVYSPLNSGLNREVIKRNIRLGIQAEVNIQRSLRDYVLVFFGSFDENYGTITIDDTSTCIPFSDLITEKEEV